MSGVPARLLLVDDDESVLITMQAILEAAGHQVVAAGTLAEALAEAQREDAPAPIDVVVSDLHLDEGDGLQVIAAAKRPEGAYVSCEATPAIEPGWSRLKVADPRAR